MNIQSTLDRSAIALSTLCAVHCLVLPVALLILPSFMSLTLDNEAFHRWLLVAVIPISLVALTMGCQEHKRLNAYLLGGLGIALLGIAGFFGHDHLGEVGEKAMTTIGAVILAVGHLINYRLCQKNECRC